ncbi:MAG: hypothetical protein RIA09_16220 [Hoeflea sp.]|jgi:hypothetical protein|uniref:hypothetical protein n=1 Tax=Hoeflea sp. TaxID=1940281 RepID=UPI0032EAD0E2
MKTKLDTTAHEVVGSQETRDLTIEANGKAFKELISGIYSDKAYAIARETMANCVDSHVEAGTPERAFDIQIPSILNPEYMVRDYGVSMTHDVVMTLYSTLFRSTKDDPNSDESNKFVGKFGLGSKSPFSYTDAFQLTAYLDGYARIYDIYFNGGVPRISLFAQFETEEENGIKITFPVDPKDCKDFGRAIVRAVEGLPVLPNFIGTQPNLPERKVLDKGEGWRLVDATGSGYAEAKQGTVLYPLNFEAVIDCPSDLAYLFKRPFQFEFQIGELDVTTSRESLSYDEETSANIIKRLQEVKAEMRGRYTKQILAAQTFHEFNLAISRIREKLNGDLFSFLSLDQLTYKGKLHRQNYNLKVQDIIIYDLDAEKNTKTFLERQPRFCDGHFMEISSRLKGTYYNNTIPKFKSSNTLSIRSNAPFLHVIVEDTSIRPRYTAQRLELIKGQIKYNDRGEYVWLRTDGGKIETGLKRIQAACGRIPLFVTHLKDIPYQPERLARTASGEVNAEYRVLSRSEGGFINPGDEPAPEDAYYVPLIRDSVEGLSITVRRLSEIRAAIVKLGAPDLPIIGIQKSHRKLIKDQEGWLPFIEIAEKHLRSSMTKKDLVDYFYSRMAISDTLARQADRLKTVMGKELFDRLTGGTILEEYCQAIDYHEHLRDTLETPPAMDAMYNLRSLGFEQEPELIKKARAKAEERLNEFEVTYRKAVSVYGLLLHFSLNTIDRYAYIRCPFEQAKEMRELKAPFYGWLKSCRQKGKKAVTSTEDNVVALRAA